MDKLDNEYLRKMGAKIKKYRKQKGMTQGDLAAAAGFRDRSSIAQIENGINDISRDRFIKIAGALDVDVAVLLFDQDNNERRVVVECASVPVLSSVTAVTSETVGSVEIPSKLEGDYFGFYMPDDAMSPFILPGDLLIVKRQPVAGPDDIVLISINGEPAVVRRFQREKKTIILLSDNLCPKYRPLVFPSDCSDSLSMVGVIKEIRRTV